MTDFIHEHPKNEETAPAAPPAPEPELDEKTGQKRVYGYIFLLFIVAFSLLLWAFFMNQRGTDRVLSELRGNADALQTTLDRNIELEKRVDELENEAAGLRDELAAQETQARTLDQELAQLRNEQEASERRATAHGYLWQLEYHYAAGNYDACRAILAKLEPYRDVLLSEGYAEALPDPLSRYEEIAAALAEQDAT